MKRTQLIQRLEKPTGRINGWAFGGGLRNGGLSDQAAEILKDIWSFDYMGSAEFEFGKVPKALTIIQNYVVAGNAYTDKLPLKKDVHYICETSEREEVVNVIKKLAENEHYFGLQEPCYLKETLCGEMQNYAGWLELDNGFLFFVDGEMYKKVLELLEMK